MQRFMLGAIFVGLVLGTACGGCEDETQPGVDAGDVGGDAGDVGGDDMAPQPDAGSDLGETDMGQPDVGHNEALEQLGVSLEVGPRLDPQGNAVPEDYNPLGRPNRHIHKLSEIYSAGITIPGSNRQAFSQDIESGWAELYTETAEDNWTQLPKFGVAADVDGDQRDETVVVLMNNNAQSADYKRLYLRVIEDADDGYLVDEVELGVMEDYISLSGRDWFKLDAAAGDIDGDGADELMVTLYDTLWVLDDENAGHTLLRSDTFPQTGDVQFLRVGAGDLDGDGSDEFVVVDGQITSGAGTATYHVYDGLTPVETGNVQVSIDSVPYQLATADVALGDFDGDGLDEVAFSGRLTGTGTNQVLVMDDAINGYEFFGVRYSFTRDFYVLKTDAGDFDGDGVDELVTGRHVLDDLNHLDENGLLDRVALMNHLPWYSVPVSVGDVNNDWREDIVYINGDSGDQYYVVFGMDSTGVYRQLDAYNILNDPTWPTIVLPNVDDDSAVVRFVDSETLFTAPHVLAVLTAPPSYADVPMDSSSGTSFGEGTSTTVDQEKSIGISTGVSVGTEFEDRLFTQSKVKFSVTVETSLDWTATESREISKSYFYNGTGESDKVVFTTIPFDVYYYEVTGSPVAAEVGSTMVINVPREPKVLFVDRDFYNSNNGDFPDIDERVVSHTVGDPSSYPTESSIDFSALEAAGGVYSDTRTVGQGPGSQTTDISLSDSVGYGSSFDVSVTVESEVGSGGFTVGSSRGFHYGYGYAISSTESTTYSGTVGNILDADDWTEFRFDFGLFVEVRSLAGQKFPVISYWVD